MTHQWEIQYITRENGSKYPIAYRCTQCGYATGPWKSILRDHAEDMYPPKEWLELFGESEVCSNREIR